MQKKEEKKVSVNTPVLAKPVSEARATLNVSDALQVLQFLGLRKVLCTRCGFRLGIYENQYNRHCNGCKNTDQIYNDKVPKGISLLDYALGEKLDAWVGEFLGKV